MQNYLTFIAGLAFASTSAMASTSIAFGDSSFAMSMPNGADPAGSPVVTFGLFDDGSDAPVVMFLNASDPYSMVRNTIPTFATPAGSPTNLVSDGKGVSTGGESKEFPSSVVLIPLPAPAGLALAGVLLIAGIRRR